MMKELIFVVCLFFYTTIAVENEDLQGWVDKCRTQTGFDKKNYSDLETLVKDPEAKTFFLCVAKVGDMLDSSGMLRRNSVREVLPAQIKESGDVEKLLNDCLHKKSSPEETVYQAFICVEKRIYYMMNGETLDI